MIAAQIQTEDLTHEELVERMMWCKEKFGPEAKCRDSVCYDRPWMREYSSYTRGYWWYFVKEEYATLFVLRWL